ncbi:hypothetical protein LY76DRAFT_239123 [Colletotrichum caudatum]|nr:hypothetical protein LY76DRAFT_239123 [Colletotrichum caudatum]
MKHLCTGSSLLHRAWAARHRTAPHGTAPLPEPELSACEPVRDGYDPRGVYKQTNMRHQIRRQAQLLPQKEISGLVRQDYKTKPRGGVRRQSTPFPLTHSEMYL